jgi:starvation-inducible DNA-binding protein
MSDENVLYLKTKNSQWNIEGTDFYDMHKFFEMQIEQLNGITDMFAERIRAIGH